MTYAELEKYANAFAAKHLQSLVLIGPPGIGKSSAFRNVLGSDVCWIAGNASPFGIYLNAFEHRNEPVVLDDVDDLCRTSQGIRLLKSWCQTDAVRTLSWHTQAAELNRRAIPREFKTTSSVALIANEWETISPNIAAVEDRVHLLVFDPTPLEIHTRTSLWFWDQEIFDFIGVHLSLLEHHSMRLYVRAWELRSAEIDWRSSVLAQCYRGLTLEVARLKADRTFLSEEERAQAFVRAGHGCRATYFNNAKRLRAPMDVPPIILTSKKPAGTSPRCQQSSFRQRRRNIQAP